MRAVWRFVETKKKAAPFQKVPRNVFLTLHESAKEYLRSNNVVCWLFKAFVGNFHHRKSDIKVVDTGQEVKT